MGIVAQDNITDKTVLCEALFNVQDKLGLTDAEIGQIIGKDRTSVQRIKKRGEIDTRSKTGELTVYLIRIYRSLYALMGGDFVTMRHWLNVDNSHIGGVPGNAIQKISGLIQVTEYLDAMRGKL